jgi:hypothetical protein
VRRVSRQFWEIAEFKKVPGIGEVGAHVFSASSRIRPASPPAQKLIKYARLAITDRSSDGKPLGYQRLERRGRLVHQMLGRRPNDRARDKSHSSL